MPFQLDRLERDGNGDLTKATVVFLTDLPANATYDFQLTMSPESVPPAVENGVTVAADGANRLMLDNGVVAVRLPAGEWQAEPGVTRAAATAALDAWLGVDSAGDVPGPVLGVRLASGRWSGVSYIRPFEKLSRFVNYIGQDLFQDIDATDPAGQVTGCRSVVEANGPLVARVRVEYAFAQGGHYIVVVEMRAGEPLIRFDEEYADAGVLQVDFNGFAPSNATAIVCNKTVAQNLPLTYEKSESRFLFVGYNYYFRQIGQVVGLTGDASGDVLGLLATDANWFPYPYNQGIHVVSAEGPAISLRANLHNGQRHWAMLVADKKFLQSVEEDEAQKLTHWWHERVAFPLSKITAWDIEWAGMENGTHPDLLFAATDLPDIRQRLEGDAAVAGLLAKVTAETAAAAYLVTGEERYLEQARDPKFFAALDSYVNAIMFGRGMIFTPLYGSIMEHTDILGQRAVALDLLLGSDLLTKAEKRTLLRKLALVTAYMFDSNWLPPSYPYEPTSGKPYYAYVQGTPNQKTCFNFTRALYAALLEGHPRQSCWFEYAIADFERVVPASVHASGALLESPFYSSRDTMRWGPFWVALRRKGASPAKVESWLARHKRAFTYLSDMLTPPEPWFGGRRVYHPLGRSNSGVVDPTFAMTGLPWGADDGGFASRMCWAWNEQQRPSLFALGGTGGRDPAWTLLGYKHNWTLPEQAPLRSVRYEGMGAILRSGVGSEYESNVVFRHDPFCWDLYSGNNGAVYFYGKGVPLMPRIGAYWNGKPSLMSPPFGNRLLFSDELTAATVPDGAIGTLEHCALLGNMGDLASGVTKKGDWRRQVLFAKDMSADDPVYLLVRDDVYDSTRANATHWWIFSKAVQPEGTAKRGVVPSFGYTDGERIEKLGRNWEGAPKLTGQAHRFECHFGMSLDMFIAWPLKPQIVSDAVGAEKMPYAVEKVIEVAQLVRSEQKMGGGHLALFMPRRVGQPQAECRTIADGAGVAVRCDEERAVLFLADKKVLYRDRELSFTGSAGYVRQGGAVPLRLMVRGGKVTASGFTLEADGAVALAFDGKEAVVAATDTPYANVSGPPGVPIRFE